MDRQQIISKIMEKKDFSKLPIKDVEMALAHFERRDTSDEEKIRLTRELLHKVFSSFTSQKLLSPKDKSVDWILRKHLSTRERLPYYDSIYSRIFRNLEGKINVFDLGAGVNGFSYSYFKQKVNYLAVEAVGQLVELMSDYFKKNKFDAKLIHMSLFELEKLKGLIKKTKGNKVVFLFKTLDSLEMMEKDYSKKILMEITPIVDFVVVSFATRSMISRKKFNVSRNWIIEFIKENFKLIDAFEIGDEKYVKFEKK